jgi:hypothetical protein
VPAAFGTAEDRRGAVRRTLDVAQRCWLQDDLEHSLWRELDGSDSHIRLL